MTAKAAIARILQAEGVEFLSCFPESPLIDACAVEGIRPVIARSERVVVNIADGFSRAARGGRVGVCAIQHDAGIENAFAGVAQAYADSVPILVLPGYGERRRQHVPPFFDAVENFRGVTKWAAQINMAERVPELLRRAFVALRTGRKGPVLLELPADVADEELPDEPLRYMPVARPRTGPDPADVARAVDLLFEAERPIILAGAGVHAAEAEDSLKALAELLRIPVMTSMNGKGALAEDHPLALGMAGLSATAMVDHFLRQADVVLAVGSSLTRWWMAAPIPDGCRLIQCTIDERDLAKDYSIEHAVLGDARIVLDALTAEADRRLEDGRRPLATDPVAEILEVKRAWLARWRPLLDSDEVPLNPYRVVRELAGVLDRRRSIVTHESGFVREQLAPFFESLTPLGYVGWGHSTQLGYSLGLALGMKLARPEHTVVNVMGDAGFGMVGMDLETASRCQIGILTVVLKNSVMAGYEAYLPIAADRYGAKHLGGEYAQIAEALGAYAERVECAEEIRPAIVRGLEQTRIGRPALLEMITREETRIPVYW
jgi:thiamine pyrophosphate-dependent acetolactate synthase large subunit-like protein